MPQLWPVTRIPLGANRSTLKNDDPDQAPLALSTPNSAEVAPTLVEDEAEFHNEPEAKDLHSAAIPLEVDFSNEATRQDLPKDEDRHKKVKYAQQMSQLQRCDTTIPPHTYKAQKVYVFEATQRLFSAERTGRGCILYYGMALLEKLYSP